MKKLNKISFACVCVLTAYPLSIMAQDNQSLETVTVTAIEAKADGMRPETVKAGSFWGANIMEVPSTVNVVTREALDLQAAEGVYDALRNTAGVTRQQNGGETWDQLVIRGMQVQNRTNYRLNGALPIMNFSQVSMENKERVEVLKGASALYYGFTSPSGIVNFTTKRAGNKPNTSAGISVNQYGSAVGSVDIGRKFGDAQQFGIRINAAGGQLGTYLHDVKKGNRSFASLAFDWRVNSRLSLKADLEHDRRKVIEQAGVNLPAAVNGVMTLPNPVNPRNLVGIDSARFKTKSTNALIRADYAVTDNWSLSFEAGQAKLSRERNLPIFTFTNPQAVATGAGRVTGNSQNFDIKSTLLKAEAFGVFKTGQLEHELTIGVSRTKKSQDPVYRSNYTAGAQNLYSPTPFTNITYTPVRLNSPAYSSQDNGVYLLDRIKVSEQWQVIAGLRRSQYKSNQGAVEYNVSKTTPVLALIYKVNPNLSFYGSYAKGLEEGNAAPANTANAGIRLDPGVSTQKEIGARWLANNGTLISAAIFDIDRTGYYTDANNVYVASGKQRYTGLELSAQGALTKHIDWLASAQFLDPRFSKMSGNSAAYNGKRPENASRQTASLFFNYKAPFMHGLALSAGAYFTGKRPVNDLNQAFLPSNTLFALGAKYQIKKGDNRHSFQLNIENLSNKRYWAGAGTRLASGAPRTIKFAYRWDM